MKNYTTYNRRFFFGVLLTLGIIWCLCLFVPKEFYFDPTYVEWQVKLETLNDQTQVKPLKTIVVGDSAAASSFSGEQLGDQFFNFALSGSNFIEAYYLIKKIDQVADLDTVIISLVPSYLNKSTFFWTRSIGFKLFENDFTNMILEDIDPSTLSYFGVDSPLDFTLKQIGYTIGSPEKYFIPMIKGMLARRWQKASYFRNKIQRTRGHMSFGTADCWNEPSGLSGNQSFKINPIQEEYLDRILQRSNTEGFKLYFFMPPMNIASQKLESRNNNEFTRYLQSKGLKIIGPQFIDNCYFGDKVHPNQKGSVYLSNYLKDYLSKVN